MEHALELPHDVDALRILALEHRETIVAREATIAEQRERIAELVHQYQVLKKLAFGRASDVIMSLPVSDSPLFYLGVPALLLTAFRLMLGRERDDTLVRIAEYIAIVFFECPGSGRATGGGGTGRVAEALPGRSGEDSGGQAGLPIGRNAGRAR